MSAQWTAVTSFGTVKVWAESENQARSRAKWKAAHEAFNFRNRADELTTVRDCEVFRIYKAKEAARWIENR